MKRISNKRQVQLPTQYLLDWDNQVQPNPRETTSSQSSDPQRTRLQHNTCRNPNHKN